MLLSFNALNYALYHNKNRLVKPELYVNSTPDDEKNNDSACDDICLINAVILLIVELVFLFYAIQIVLVSYRNTKELVIHLLLAIFFTIPYVFINVLFNTESYNLFIQK